MLLSTRDYLRVFTKAIALEKRIFYSSMNFPVLKRHIYCYNLEMLFHEKNINKTQEF